MRLTLVNRVSGRGFESRHPRTRVSKEACYNFKSSNAPRFDSLVLLRYGFRAETDCILPRSEFPSLALTERDSATNAISKI